MAPFGKNFLKARQRNRTKDKDAEPAAGKEIQVTVCDEDKVVCGVTKRTTCADLIQALLEDHRSTPESRRLLHGEAEDFCLVERWKGFERALPPLTRILRLWVAWGDQRPAVRFALVKTSDFVPPPAAKKAGKSEGAKPKPPKRWDHGRAQSSQPLLPAERQKRVVKKAFRKLEKLHRESKESCCPGAGEVERMVQLILDQDHAIREQIRRMRALDSDIERFEPGVPEEEEAEREGSGAAHADEQQRREHLYAGGDGVERLELQVQRHRELILELSRDIDAELRRADFHQGQYGGDGGQQEGAAAAAATASRIPSETDESLRAGELERLQDEVERSLRAGVALRHQEADVSERLKRYEATLVSKDRECRQLAAQLSSLQIGGGGEEEVEEEEEEEEEEASPVPPPKSETQCGVSQTVKLKPGPSPLDVTDTDSDTGISSTHSQDSLSPCLDFPPTLDTDV